MIVKLFQYNALIKPRSFIASDFKRLVMFLVCFDERANIENGRMDFECQCGARERETLGDK